MNMIECGMHMSGTWNEAKRAGNASIDVVRESKWHKAPLFLWLISGQDRHHFFATARLPRVAANRRKRKSYMGGVPGYAGTLGVYITCT